MSTPTIADYLKYANLQLAAESLFGFDAYTAGINGQPLKPADLKNDTPLTVDDLTTGNLHTSKMAAAEVQMSGLTTDWVVVQHISNTTTGFSGTLFKAIKDDPATGTKAGEFVMSMRSTEFIDDAARDCEATNNLEIKKLGWAFGQIDDMNNWYQSIKDTIGSAPLTVTGYSLGAHQIAGSSLKIIDMQTHEVIAERIGYMIDLGQGNKSGGRSPWLLAADHACPSFHRNPLSTIKAPGSASQAHQTQDFVEKVLNPKLDK